MSRCLPSARAKRICVTPPTRPGGFGRHRQVLRVARRLEHPGDGRHAAAARALARDRRVRRAAARAADGGRRDDRHGRARDGRLPGPGNVRHAGRITFWRVPLALFQEGRAQCVRCVAVVCLRESGATVIVMVTTMMCVCVCVCVLHSIRSGGAVVRSAC